MCPLLEPPSQELVPIAPADTPPAVRGGRDRIVAGPQQRLPHVRSDGQPGRRRRAAVRVPNSHDGSDSAMQFRRNLCVGGAAGGACEDSDQPALVAGFAFVPRARGRTPGCSPQPLIRKMAARAAR